MNRVELVNKLDVFSQEHPGLSAGTVAAFCMQYDIPCRLTVEALDKAMSQMPYWQQGLSNYLDFVYGFEAAYSMCSKRTETRTSYNPPFVVSG